MMGWSHESRGSVDVGVLWSGFMKLGDVAGYMGSEGRGKEGRGGRSHGREVA